MAEPFFSVVIPAYNREGFIEKAARSVLDQRFTDFELIIIDDGSRDGTAQAVKSLPESSVKYLFQENAGVSAARNRGIREAAGSFIAFLDSDDWWLFGKLKKTKLAIEENPDIRIFHTLERWYRGGKLLNQKKKHRPPSGDVFSRCLELCCVSMSTAVVGREVFEDIGFFDESMPACEDYDFWLRASVKYPVMLIEEVLTEKEGGHPGQQSMKYPAMDRFRIASIAQVLKTYPLSREQYLAAARELERKCRIMAGGCLKRGRDEEARDFLQLAERYSDFNKQPEP